VATLAVPRFASSGWAATAIALVCMSVSLTLAAWVVSVRAPYWDEGLYGGIAANLAQNNHFATSVMHPDGAFGYLPGVREHTYWTTPLYPLVAGLWFKLTGVGIVQMRCLSLALAVPMMLCWWYSLRQLTGSLAIAGIGAALISLDASVIRAMYLGRPDMLASACAAAAIAFYLRFRERHLGLALTFASALMGMAGLSHPAAAVLAAVLGVIILTRDLRRLRLIHIVCAASAGACVLLPWAAYIWQDFATFKQQWAGNMRGRTHPTLNPVFLLANDVRDRYVWLFFASRQGLQKVAALNPAAIVIAFVWAALARRFWRSERSRLFVALAATAFVALAVVDGSKYSQYLIYAFPVYLSLSAVTLAWHWNKQTLFSRLTTCCLAAAIVVPGMASAVYAGRKLRADTEFASMLSAVRAVRVDDEQITGPSELAFVFGFDGSVIDDRHMRTPSRIVVYNEHIKLATSGAEKLLLQHYRAVHTNPVWKVYVRN
jgi:hypothetical protein